MRWIRAALCAAMLAAAVVFVGAALDGHSDIYAPSAVLLATAIAFTQLRKKERVNK